MMATHIGFTCRPDRRFYQWVQANASGPERVSDSPTVEFSIWFLIEPFDGWEVDWTHSRGLLVKHVDTGRIWLVPRPAASRTTPGGNGVYVGHWPD